MTNSEELHVLSIDIGGSHIKATILNEKGEMEIAYSKIPTPKPSTPKNLLDAIKKLIKDFPAYNHISSGFPGYVKNGVVKTAPNLGTEAWKDFDLQKTYTDTFGVPALVVNDADMQGLGVIEGEGLEMVITLGTGFGTALFKNGYLLPHLELSQHPLKDGKGYDEYVGDKGLESKGEEHWNKRMKKVFEILKTVFNYDTLYIGGGNSDKLDFKLDKNMKIVNNRLGIKGGARLWQMPELPSKDEGTKNKD